MDLQSMRFFVTTADTGSFSAAAEELSYAQSNLSSRVKQLEAELGGTIVLPSQEGGHPDRQRKAVLRLRGEASETFRRGC
ncbi:MAG: LysR family transcriptional regulator [Clostridia bacterium]|nr:LysR family transcriptional regulator [Clostridia bacterium]